MAKCDLMIIFSVVLRIYKQWLMERLETMIQYLCRKTKGNDDPYLYLKNTDGSAVPREILINVGQKARRLWHSMKAIGVAPLSWGKANEDVYIYFNSEMLNKPGFEFFSEGNWKIVRCATKAYSSWAYNHIKLNKAGDGKRKHDLLNDCSLL